MSWNTVNTFKHRIHKFWLHQEAISNYKADLAGTANWSTSKRRNKSIIVFFSDIISDVFFGPAFVYAMSCVCDEVHSR